MPPGHLSLFAAVASSVLAVFAVEQWALSPYRIPSPSMEPTLHCARNTAQDNGCLGSESDRVIVNRFIYDFEQPQRGQIVVFAPPAEAAIACGETGAYVKRLIGLPGDELREDRRGFVWVRDPPHAGWAKVEEPYLSRQERLSDTTHFDRIWSVPKDEYFVMGDNRAESCDSRRWGSVPRSDLIGPVVATYWPLSRVWIATPGLTGDLVLAAFIASLGSLILLAIVAGSRVGRRLRRNDDPPQAASEAR